MKNKFKFKTLCFAKQNISLKKGNLKGFTLIELIVTITIIAILSVIAVVNFSEANRKARDTKRMSDLEKIRIALELVRQVGTTYPPASVSATGLDNLVSSGYLQSVPNGPKGDNYYYQRISNFSFTLDASLEGVGSTTGSYGANCGTGFTCNYRVTNP